MSDMLAPRASRRKQASPRAIGKDCLCGASGMRETLRTLGNPGAESCDMHMSFVVPVDPE